jgi:hypothetical protein
VSLIQTFIQKIFSYSPNNVTRLLNTAYAKNQDSKKQFFSENVDNPKLLSTEHLAKYFNLSTEDMTSILLTLPTPWIGKTVRGYLPTKEGYKQGAREAYDNYVSSTLWNESILFNEELISQINIKINTEVYQMPNMPNMIDSALENSMPYSYAQPA